MRELEAVLSRVSQPTAASTEAGEAAESDAQVRTGSRLASVGDSGLECEAPSGASSQAPPQIVIVEPRKSLLMDNIEQWGQSVHSATTSPSALLRSASGESLCSKITEDEDPLLSRPGASLSLASFYSAHTAVTDFTDCIDHADAFDQGVEVEASTAQSFDKGVQIEASA